MRKKWVVVSGNKIILEADTKPALKKKMEDRSLPSEHSVIALPKTSYTLI